MRKRKANINAADKLTVNKTQGELFKGTAYTEMENKTFKLRGDSVSTVLYTTSRVSVTKQGKKFDGELYYKSSSGAYLAMGEPMYYKGDASDYYTRSKYADAYTLYKAGDDVTVTVGKTEYESPLYTAGTAYSNGLYANFKLASITTKDVAALTV